MYNFVNNLYKSIYYIISDMLTWYKANKWLVKILFLALLIGFLSGHVVKHFHKAFKNTPQMSERLY